MLTKMPLPRGTVRARGTLQGNGQTEGGTLSFLTVTCLDAHFVFTQQFFGYRGLLRQMQKCMEDTGGH